jgi:hypothetical protein
VIPDQIEHKTDAKRPNTAAGRSLIATLAAVRAPSGQTYPATVRGISPLLDIGKSSNPGKDWNGW